MINPWVRPDYYGLLPLAVLSENEETDDGFNMIAAWTNPTTGAVLIAHDGSSGDEQEPFEFHGITGLEEMHSLDDVVAFVESCGFPLDSRNDRFLAEVSEYLPED